MEPVKTKKPWYKREFAFGGVKDSDILLFTKHISIALQAGLPIADALDMIESQAAGKMKQVIAAIKQNVESGQSFHQSLSAFPKYFTPMYVNMIKTGELAGTLEENLKQLADSLWKISELKQKVKSAMVYPMIIFIAVIGLAFSVSVFVLPKIIPLFKTLDVKLPVTTRALLFIADITERHTAAISFGSIAAVIGLTVLLTRKFIKPSLHSIFLSIPIIKNIIKNINLVRFTRSLGNMLQSGIPLDASLNITTESTNNITYRKAIISLIPQTQKGEGLAKGLSLYPHLFPKLTIRMVAMGEQTGSLDKTLAYLADFYEQEVDTAVKNLTTALEPTMLLLIGVVVGIVAVSILGPIYQITGNLKQ